jgi:hypothetical protein
MVSCATDDDTTARTPDPMADPFAFAREYARAAGYGNNVARLILPRALGGPSRTESAA